MADETQLARLMQGVDTWNAWRKENPRIKPDLQEADLRGADLASADLRGADLYRADFTRANLTWADLCTAYLTRAVLCQANLTWAQLYRADLDRADLTGAVLRRANLAETDLKWAVLYGADLRLARLSEADLRLARLSEADLRLACLSEADLGEADLRGARLTRTDLTKASLSGARLEQALLVETDLRGANLTGCRVYGISAWGVQLDDKTEQKGLIITSENEPTITVDDLEIAQFTYLLLNNQKVRRVIDTLTTKVVLILGRFTPERKVVLDALRDRLRMLDYLPIVFDFDKPASRNLTETVSLLAHMARFVVADITDAKSIPQELQRIVPELPSVPVQPLILESQYEYAMFKDFLDYPWVLLPYRYQNVYELLDSLADKVVGPALAKANELEERHRAIEEAILQPQQRRRKRLNARRRKLGGTAS